jgi:hypothetical protein
MVKSWYVFSVLTTVEIEKKAYKPGLHLLSKFAQLEKIKKTKEII